jgi:hypothetical protein
MSRAFRLAILAVVMVGLAAAVAMRPPLRQDPAYHDFADRRALFGIPNVADVGSNLLMLAAAVAGIARLWRSHRPEKPSSLLHSTEQWLYWRFYLAAALTALGSIYYHLAPDTLRLLWDRLPLSILLASFVAMLISERIDPRAGLLTGPPLLFLAVGSVLYWYAGEMQGAGDLRLYLFVQLTVLILVPLILLLFDSPYPGESGLWWGVWLVYALAKESEQFDRQLFSLGHLISGHTLKHLLAAAAVFMTVRIRAGRDRPAISLPSRVDSPVMK